MTDMTAFERRVADEMLRRAGPVLPVDDLAVFDAVIATNRSHRWGFTMLSAVKFIAAAVILALCGGFLLTGVFSVQQGDEFLPAAQEAEAPELNSELLLELEVPRWALPDDPSALEVGEWVLEAGTDVTGERQASQTNESMRNRAIAVTSGTFLIEPTTEALVWRTPGSTPEVAPAGEAVTLRAGEAIYLPAVPAAEVDAERYLRIANPGAEDTTGFTLHVHEGSMGDPFGGFPSGLRWSTWSGRLTALLNATEWTAAEEALFRLTRHHADPGTTIQSSAAPATRVYFVESGAVERVRRGPDSESESTFPWEAGSRDMLMAVEGVEQTLTVVGDGAASFLELVAIPRSSATE